MPVYHKERTTVESKTKNPKTREQIAAMVAKAFDGMSLADRPDAIVELKDGWFNVAYRVGLADGRETILKIAPPQGADVLQYEQNIMLTEVESMRLVRANPAIPVPQIYFFDQSHTVCDSDYFFMEKIGGENLEHAVASLAPEVKADLQRQIGAIIRQVNSFTGSYFGYEGNPRLRAQTWRAAFELIMDALLEDGVRKDVALDYDRIRVLLLRHAPALDEVTTPSLVHWDAWNPNFFVKDGQINGIIDFERALWADPLMEAQFRPFFGNSVTDVMRGYGKTSFTAQEEQRCQLYTLHLALVMNIECAYRNYDTDDIFNMSRGLIETTMAWLEAH